MFESEVLEIGSERFVRVAAVLQKTSMRYYDLQLKLAAKRFPLPVRIRGATFFVLSEVEKWCRDRERQKSRIQIVK